MKKMKIAFCVRDMKVGGVESVLIRTMDMLLKNRNIELYVITYVNIKEQVYLDWFKSHPQVKVYTLYPSRWFGTDLSRFFLTRVFQHLCRDIYRWFRRNFIGIRCVRNVDLLIDYYNFSFNLEFKRILKPKLVWWHSSIDNFISGNYIRYMKHYDLLVVLTDGFVKDFKNLYPEYSDKIIRMYNPIDVEKICRKSEESVSPKGKYFCCISRLYADKDILTLLKAFDDFWNKNKKADVKLYIIGDGSFRLRYQQFAENLSAAKNIIFTGAMSNPFGYIHGAIANILSSKSEGLPTVLVEAAALNTLNISSDCRNGPREILYDGKGGLLFTPGDANALSECMDAVLNNKVPTKKMKKIAYDGLTRFDTKEISKQIIKLIKSYV